ncbi:LLM class flavin-dependent oxidoreductase [Cohnella faecalis]|uniref:LLM class flavin-dependent oxidoreductase n=1 Tax=Cohnella faecalis TaxID=2315694 RepID=A0A398CD33_9BACL|nr:LLM class flavin-dependent oxidoreductase [Cohnella faecalis]
MAAVTEHLGFAVTSSITYDHPYAMARKMSTLDHLTGGRIGWNIVTSNLNSAALNFGWREQLEHDRRYDRATNFLRCATSYGNEAGRTMRSFGIGSGASTPTRPKFTISDTRASSSRCRAFICPSHRPSGRRCSSRPAPRSGEGCSPQSTRNASF